MPEFTKPIGLTSPHTRGKRCRDAQWLLDGHNRFHEDYLLGAKVDGEWGPLSAQAADRARYRLGYPQQYVKSGRFGQQIYDYLRTDGNHKRLPLAYRLRRAYRLRKLTAASSHKLKALAAALADAKAGVRESPPGTNLQKYGAAYGLNGLPWCAMAVWYWFSRTGKIAWRTAWAYAFEDWGRRGWYRMSITRNPEPGDIVVYHHGQGHVGIFYRWVNRDSGHFQAVEGNTSNGGSQDNGGAVLIRDRWTNWAPTTFVRVGV